MSLIAYINGDYVSDAKISVFDLGLQRGFGAFDFLRTYHGKLFHVQDHLDRLFFSLKQLGLSSPLNKDEFLSIILSLIEKNALQEANVKIFITGGISKDGLLPSGKESVIITTAPLLQYPSSYYEEGIHMISFSIDRFLPCCKSLNYTPAICALQTAKKNGAFEALYVSSKNEVLEGTTCNFFGIKDNTLITPKKDILQGITRKVILHLCKDLLPIEERTIDFRELKDLDEAFISASNKEIMPVTKLDDFSIGSGRTGETTKEIMALFRAYTEKGFWDILDGRNNFSLKEHSFMD
jgi:branched-chain amino acid aminotransferase